MWICASKLVEMTCCAVSYFMYVNEIKSHEEGRKVSNFVNYYLAIWHSFDNSCIPNKIPDGFKLFISLVSLR